MYLIFVEWAKILVVLNKIFLTLKFVTVKEMKQSPVIMIKKTTKDASFSASLRA